MAQVAPPDDPRRVRRRRNSINAEIILDGAFAMATSTSLDALTMPRLAEHLQVGVTSLYWYYRSKDELLDAMSARGWETFAELTDIELPEDWSGAMRDYFIRYRDVLLADSLLCELTILRHRSKFQNARPTLEHIDRLVSKMVDAGFRPANALTAYNTLSIYTRGSVLVNRTRIAQDLPVGFVRIMEQRIIGLGAHIAPTIDKALEESGPMTEADEFLAGMETVLAGLAPLATRKVRKAKL